MKSSSDVWCVMNEITDFRKNERSKISSLTTELDKKIDTTNEIASQLASEFIVASSVSDITECVEELNVYEKVYEIENVNNNDIFRQEFTKEDVQLSVQGIKKGKEGDEHIPKRIYKLFFEQLSIPMSIIFTKILLLGKIPKCLKRQMLYHYIRGKVNVPTPHRTEPFLIRRL